MHFRTLMSITKAALTTFFSLVFFFGSTAIARNLEILGAPTHQGIGLQFTATELARDLRDLDTIILVIITIITLFVVGLLLYVIFCFRKRVNPKPASFTHNAPLEVAWTIIPVIILIFIGAFSLPVLFKQQEFPVGDITIKVTGYQWYWGYEYVDDGISFDSYMIGAPGADTKDPGDYRLTPSISKELSKAGYSDREFLLATDTAVVVPVGKTIVMQVTGADVIHSWTIPAFGVKQDAVPGRLAQLWFKAEEEGIYFGQCSELCGIAHAYMPITVKVVPQDVYDKWLADAREGDYVLSATDYEEYSSIKLVTR